MLSFSVAFIPSVSDRAAELCELPLDRMTGQDFVARFFQKPEEFAWLLRFGIVFRNDALSLEIFSRYRALARDWSSGPIGPEVLFRALDFVPDGVFAMVQEAGDPSARARSIVQRLLDDQMHGGPFLEGRELLLKVLLIRARQCGVI